VYYPDRELGQLFRDVQVKRVFADYKTFVDCSPKRPIEQILLTYEQNRSEPDFDLNAFVLANFELPPPLQPTHVTLQTDMREHLQQHWQNLIRSPQKTHTLSTLIQLPEPYVVPGGRFREMFYWDSFFTIIGLLESDEDALAFGMIKNFAFLIEQHGYIPNGNRSYFLGRSQPPFFASMLMAYADKHGLDSVAQFTALLEKEYLFWMDFHQTVPHSFYRGKHLVVLNNGDYLNRYFGARGEARAEAFGKETRWAAEKDEPHRHDFFRHLRAVCESGWDFSSRWYADGLNKRSVNAMNILPVDLNSLMYLTETSLARLYQHQNNQEKHSYFTERAATRKEIVGRVHFDPDTGTFQDVDLDSGAFTGRLSLAMLYPLFTGVASEAQAASVAKLVEEQFLHAGGLVTTLVNSAEQWDSPNGWAPLQYIGVYGLLRYKHNALALEVARRWLDLNEKVYHDEGKMMEKYNVIDPKVKAGGGEYPNQDGFGWTNGVNLAFYRLLDD